MNICKRNFKIKIFVLLIIIILFGNCTGQPMEIKVGDFGVMPDDGKDDIPAIISAIEICRNQKNVKLVFEFGSYDICGSKKDENGNFKPSLDIKNITNLTIEGNNAEFIGHDLSTMFYFTECKNLTITDLSIDWDPLPFTHGKIVGVDNDHIDIEVAAPFIAQLGRRTEGLLGYDFELRKMARRYTDYYQKGYEKILEIIRPGVMRLFIGRDDRFTGKLPPVVLSFWSRT